MIRQHPWLWSCENQEFDFVKINILIRILNAIFHKHITLKEKCQYFSSLCYHFSRYRTEACNRHRIKRQYFLPFCRLCLCFFRVSFDTKVFNYDDVKHTHTLIFTCIVSYLWKHFLIQNNNDVIPCFLEFLVLALTYRSKIFFVLIFLYSLI